MACIVYMTNKKSGYVYAYESVSYRDPITKKPKSKRKYLGRVDPITKEFLKDPVKKKTQSVSVGTSSQSKELECPNSPDSSALRADIIKLQADVKKLEEQIASLKKSNDETGALLASIGQTLNEFKSINRP